MSNPVVLGILISIALTLITTLSQTDFLTTSLSFTLLHLLKSARIVLSLSASKLSTLVFKLVKSAFDASVVISMPGAPFRLAFATQLDPIQLVHSHQNIHIIMETIDSL